MIKALYLKDFRNYKEANVTFSPTINVIWGDNAQGKTNLLEALYLFITGRSFRTPHLNELIRLGADSFHLQILIEKNGIEQTLKFSFDGKLRKITYNSTPLINLSSLLGILNGVMLSPDDRALIKGGPATRRQFLDFLLSQAKPLYLFHLSRYLRAMKQRNSLLKQQLLQTIPVWEEQMAIAAVFLTQMRSQTVDELKPLSQSEMLGSDLLELIYRSQALATAGLHAEDLQSFFLKQFSKNRQRECHLGISLCGPHRDDFSILIHNQEARQFASEGQQRSCISSLKLAQWKWLKTSSGQTPILCIDDLGVSFDFTRESEFYKRVQNLHQVFITSTRSPPLECHLIHIKNGSLG